MPNHEVSLRFPFTVEEMQRYDVIVLSDAPADSFLLHPDTLAGEIVPNRLAVIGDYVRAGGGFAMIGGWMAFGGFHGKAHYAYSPMAQLLPVAIAPDDDRMETPEGVYPEVLAPEHPILAGLAADWPDFLGYNRFAATRGETLLRVPRDRRSAARGGGGGQGPGGLLRLRHPPPLGLAPLPGLAGLHEVLGQPHDLARPPDLA